MIVAVTGGTGFIGRKLVMRHLARGDEVRVLSRRFPEAALLTYPVKWQKGDLSGNSNLQSFVDGVDVLYHCAAEIRDVSKMQAVNVDATLRLIDAASGRISRWVQLSSAGVYGKKPVGVVSEGSELNPVGVYESTKLASDIRVENAALEGAFQHVILRPSNVYGDTMRNRSLYRLISIVNRGLFFFIGRPGACANYIHVENVIDALILCGSHPAAAGQIYNISDYRSLEVFMGLIARALDKASPSLRLPESPVRWAAKLIGRVPGATIAESNVDALTSRAIYSCEKIERELGYRHAVSMEQGLHELVGTWKRNGSTSNDIPSESAA